METKVEVGSRTWKMRNTMCKMWANFAKFGDPTPSNIATPLPFKWNPAEALSNKNQNIDLDYLVINDEPKMVRNRNKHRMDFWREVYRRWNKSFIASKL